MIQILARVLLIVSLNLNRHCIVGSRSIFWYFFEIYLRTLNQNELGVPNSRDGECGFSKLIIITS